MVNELPDQDRPGFPFNALSPAVEIGKPQILHPSVVGPLDMDAIGFPFDDGVVTLE
jgi:hypothetical protein